MNDKSIIYVAPRGSGKTSAILRLAIKDALNGKYVAIKTPTLSMANHLINSYKKENLVQLHVEPKIICRIDEQSILEMLQRFDKLYWDEFGYERKGEDTILSRKLFKTFRKAKVPQVMATTPAGGSKIANFFKNNPEDFELIHLQDMSIIG